MDGKNERKMKSGTRLAGSVRCCDYSQVLQRNYCLVGCKSNDNFRFAGGHRKERGRSHLHMGGGRGACQVGSFWVERGLEPGRANWHAPPVLHTCRCTG